MPLLKKEEKEKLYAGHSMKLEEGKWVHDGESARIVITFGKSKLKDGSEREEVLVHIDHKYREQSHTYITKTPTPPSPILSSIDMEFDRKTAKLISFKSFTKYVTKIEFEVNLEQEKEWLSDFLASREEKCTYRGLKMESQGPQEGLTGRSNEVWRSESKDGEHATIQITDNLIGVAHHKKHGEDGVDYQKKFTPEGEMLSINSHSDSLGSILTLDVAAEEQRMGNFLSQPEEVKRSRLRNFGRMLLDRIRDKSGQHEVEVDRRKVIMVGKAAQIPVDEKHIIFAGRTKKGIVKRQEVEWETRRNEKGFLFRVKGEHPFEIQVHMRHGELYFEVAPRTESWQFRGLHGETDDLLSMESVKQAWVEFKKGELIKLDAWGTERLTLLGKIVQHEREIRKGAEIYK